MRVRERRERERKRERGKEREGEREGRGALAGRTTSTPSTGATNSLRPSSTSGHRLHSAGQPDLLPPAPPCQHAGLHPLRQAPPSKPFQPARCYHRAQIHLLSASLISDCAHYSPPAMAERLSSSTSLAYIGACFLPSTSRLAVTRSSFPFLPTLRPLSFRSAAVAASLRPPPLTAVRLSIFQGSHGHSSSYGGAAEARCAASDPAQLRSAREDINELLKTKFCHPILVSLGWHDAGTYDKNIEEWPQRGGANGSLRYDIELKHAANAGLVNALKLLQPIKDKYYGITFADLFQLASAAAVEEAGGPKIPMKYGRVDVSRPEQCPEEGKLPAARPPSPAGHLREVFFL